MDETEDDECVRFFQWEDDEQLYSSSSILARLQDTKSRRIRRAEGDEEPYTQEELDKLPDKKELKVKWFVPIGGTCYRFPARVLPHFQVRSKDNFREELIQHLHNSGLSRDFQTRILDKYDSNPNQFQRDLGENITNKMAELTAKRLDKDEIPKLEEEIRKYTKQYQALEGATSQLIEAVRSKWTEEVQSDKENQQGQIVFASQTK